MRERNKIYYRILHWPIWIWVFFLAPGPLVFDLFERGFDGRMGAWLSIVLIGTAIAGLRGQLPGVEPKPYIILFNEDKPNPLYRRVCYTFAWSTLISFAVLNTAGLMYAVVTGEWRLKQMYEWGYFLVAGVVWLFGALGKLPRVKSSTRGEGYERRYFYGAVWSVSTGQAVLWWMWKALPRTTTADVVKLLVFAGIVFGLGSLAAFGRLPRTRPVLPSADSEC
jgi:hypothetical protein